MLTISKAIEVVREDVNNEDSILITIFERITSAIFKGVLFLGLPLLTYIILFL